MSGHNHPLVRKEDLRNLNARYAPWRIEKATSGKPGEWQTITQARNVETDEVFYRCEGWTQASRGQALNAILERVNAIRAKLVPPSLPSGKGWENDADSRDVDSWSSTRPADDDRAGGRNTITRNADADMATPGLDVAPFGDDPDAEICRKCGHRADWHDASDMQCPDDDAPHPYSYAADATPNEPVTVKPIVPRGSLNASEHAKLESTARELLAHSDGRYGVAIIATGEMRYVVPGTSPEDLRYGAFVDYGEPMVRLVDTNGDTWSHGATGTELDDAPSIEGVAFEGFRDTSPDAIAARIAREAAETFEYDADREDDSSAAQRAADILRDLSPDDVPAFLSRVFGLPVSERYTTEDIAYHRSRVNAEPGTAYPEDWTERVREAGRERGIPDVARMLVCDYRDIVRALAFMGHDATGDRGESTNLSAWREACDAFNAVNALSGHAFGGYALDGYADDVNRLATVALDAMIVSVQWAAYNSREPFEPVYWNEPRGE